MFSMPNETAKFLESERPAEFQELSLSLMTVNLERRRDLFEKLPLCTNLRTLKVELDLDDEVLCELLPVLRGLDWLAQLELHGHCAWPEELRRAAHHQTLRRHLTELRGVSGLWRHVNETLARFKQLRQLELHGALKRPRWLHRRLPQLRQVLVHHSLPGAPCCHYRPFSLRVQSCITRYDEPILGAFGRQTIQSPLQAARG